MTTFNQENIREEIVNTLRNSDLFTISVRGVTTVAETFTATAGQTVFVLTNSGVRNIRSLTVQTVSKYIFKDYTINWVTKTITLNTGATVSDSVVITYDYGTSDRIYPDMPRNDLTLNSYPRIGMSIVDINTYPIGLTGLNHVSDILITIFIWVPINKDTNVGGGFGGTHDLNDFLTSIRTTIRSNGKSFNTFNYITPRGQGVIDLRHHIRTDRGDLTSGQNNKLIQASQDYVIKFVFEIG